MINAVAYWISLFKYPRVSQREPSILFFSFLLSSSPPPVFLSLSFSLFLYQDGSIIYLFLLLFFYSSPLYPRIHQVPQILPFCSCGILPNICYPFSHFPSSDHHPFSSEILPISPSCQYPCSLLIHSSLKSQNKMSILFKAFQWLAFNMALMITSKNFNRISNWIQ